MNRSIYFLILFSLLSLSKSFACTVDVQIMEGDAISFCESNITDINASAGFVSYVWSGTTVGTGQSITPDASGWLYVDATDGVGCVSTDSILITINPNPTPSIVSSEGSILCASSSGTVLSLDQSYSAQLWSTGSSNPTIQVNETNTFTVDVTDENGCVGSAAISITKVEFGFTVGNTSICEGSATYLTASGGDAYAWSTGEFGETIVVAPSTTTTYSVTVFKGSCQTTFQQEIVVMEAPDYELEDTLYVLAGDQLSIAGPSGFNDFQWTPALAVSNPNAAVVSYMSDTSSMLTFTALSPGGCYIQDSVYVFVIDLTIPGGFSPNGDGKNDIFYIRELDGIAAGLIVWNRWGDIVYQSDFYTNDWNGTCQTDFCFGNQDLPDGTYYYAIEIYEASIKGFLTLRR